MIGDSRHADKYTKSTEPILNQIPGTFNKGNNVKEALEELNNYNYDFIKTITPDTTPVKGSVEAIIFIEEGKNWFIRKTN